MRISRGKSLSKGKKRMRETEGRCFEMKKRTYNFKQKRGRLLEMDRQEIGELGYLLRRRKIDQKSRMLNRGE